MDVFAKKRVKGAAIGGAVGGSSLRDTGSSLRDAGSSLRDASSSLRATQGKQQKRVCRGRKGGAMRAVPCARHRVNSRKRCVAEGKEGMRALPCARHRENSRKRCVAEEKKRKEKKRKEKKGKESSEHKTRTTLVTDKPPYFKYLAILTPFFVTTREVPESMVTLIVTSAV